MTSSKKGISAHQLHRMMDISYEAAWFMAHRIRESMRSGGLAPLGGEGKIVEPVRRTTARRKSRPSPRNARAAPYKTNRGQRNKRPIVALGECGGRVHTFHVAVADRATVEKIVSENVAREFRLHIDESKVYFNAP
jgi:hypothetical protein